MQPGTVSKQTSMRLALVAAAALLGACSEQAVYTSESFSSDTPFKLKVEGEPVTACEGARRSLLGNGYLIENADEEQVKARKARKNADKLNTFIEINVVCVSDNVGSTMFANGVVSTYDLKKSSSAASVGVSAVGSISLPIGQSADSLVKIGEETIDDAEFYRRFFAAVQHTLGEMQVRSTPEEPPATAAAPAVAVQPIETTPAAAAAPAVVGAQPATQGAASPPTAQPAAPVAVSAPATPAAALQPANATIPPTPQSAPTTVVQAAPEPAAQPIAVEAAPPAVASPAPVSEALPSDLPPELQPLPTVGATAAPQDTGAVVPRSDSGLLEEAFPAAGHPPAAPVAAEQPAVTHPASPVITSVETSSTQPAAPAAPVPVTTPAAAPVTTPAAAAPVVVPEPGESPR